MTLRNASHRVIALMFCALQTLAQAGAHGTVSSQTASDSRVHDSMKSLIEQFAGEWSIHLSSPASGPDVGKTVGEGQETWRAGPGSNSLIEEYHSTGTEGEIIGLGIYWPVENQTGLKVFWCDNTAPSGCRTLKNTAAWKPGRLVLSERRLKDGKDMSFEENFVFDSPDSFTQTLSEGKSHTSLRPFLIIRAIRKKP
jgi:hypothetical protein